MKGLLVRGGLLMAMALLGTNAMAQAGAARGKVQDEKGQPLQDVVVTIEYQGGMNRKNETKTNKKGEFTQVGMAPGVYRFSFMKAGYQSQGVEQKISLGEATELPLVKMPPGTSVPMGKEGAAAAAAAQAAREKSQALQGAFAAATEQLRAGKYDEAEGAFKTLAAANPTIPEIQYNLGQVYEGKKDMAAAEAAYLKAIEIKPSYTDAASALAGVYQRTGHADKAAALMAKSAGENKDDPNVQFNLGVTHLNAGRNEEAVTAFQRVVELKPDMAEAYYRLGTLYVGQGKVDDAVKSLQKYLSLNPTDAANTATAKGLLAALKK
jgi:tetratricopeptide (TPR) repeat protein